MQRLIMVLMLAVLLGGVLVPSPASAKSLDSSPGAGSSQGPSVALLDLASRLAIHPAVPQFVGNTGQAAAQMRAVASRSCYIICDGQNPQGASYEDSYGNMRLCDDARTIDHKPGDGDPGIYGYVELRYSRKCRMAWARGVVHFWVEGFNADGSSRVVYPGQYFGPDRPGRPWTDAVNDAGITARACVADPVSTHGLCTRKY